MDFPNFLYEQVPVLMRDLHQDTPALWGKMNAQQMVEHLAFVVSHSNGRFRAIPNAEPEKLAYRKMRYFEKDFHMPRHFRVEAVPEEPMPLQFPDIEQAKMFFFQQMQRFDDYYSEHHGITAPHFTMGELNFDEWVQAHARHFRHHFKQFGLLAENFGLD